MSDTTAIRNPLNAGSSWRSRIGTCSRSGGPSALAVPTPTRPTDAAPAATALARARNTRRFSAGEPWAHLGGPARSVVSVASSGPLHPAPQREPDGLQHEQCQKQVRDQAEPEVARPREPRRLGHPDDARQDQRRDQQRRERDERRREDPSRASRPGRVLDQPFPEVEVHQPEDRAENNDEHARPSDSSRWAGRCARPLAEVA